MEFLNYFKALQRSPRPKSQPLSFVVAGYVLIFAGAFMGGLAGWVPIIASFAFAAGLCISYWCTNKPNYETAFPVNHRKKLFYRFMSSLLLFVIFVATILAVLIVSAIFVMLFTAIASGGFGWIREGEVLEEAGEISVGIFSSLGVYGGLFGLAYFIILYSSGMITGFIKKRKIRNIFLTCLCAGVLLSWLIMCIPYCVSTGSIIGTSPFKSSCYTAMGVPWLSTVFWMLVAVGFLAASIYLGIKHYDPKKF